MFECVELTGMRHELAEFAGRFDADVLDGDAASAVVKDAALIENIAASIKAAAAKRVADTHAYRKGGHRSAAHQLAHASGTEKAAAVADAASLDPSAEQRLVDHAHR